MRIAYLIHRFPWPSETFITREIFALLNQGIDLRLYSFEAPDATTTLKLSELALKLQSQTQYLTKTDAAIALASNRLIKGCLLNAKLPAQGGMAKNALRLGRALALAKRLKQDGVTHLHAHWPYATAVASIAAELTGIPYSISVHAHEVAHDNAHFPHVFQTLTFAAFCNAAARDYLLQRLPPAAADKATLIYHGVDTLSFDTNITRPSAPHQRLKLVSAGRVTPTKGFDRLIRHIRSAVDADIDVELTIIGDGPSLPELKALASSLNLSDRVHLTGWVNHGKIREYYLASHAFALVASTDYNDGLPNVLLEAMSCGRTAIVSPLPAAKEAITPGVNGFILSEDHPDISFMAALKELSVPGTSERMGEEARKSMVEKYDERIHIKELKRLFEIAQ